jgi:hypothetical protein
MELGEIEATLLGYPRYVLCIQIAPAAVIAKQDLKRSGNDPVEFFVPRKLLSHRSLPVGTGVVIVLALSLAA